MYMPGRTLYRTPFSAAYWQAALADFKQVRTLTFAALMIVACVALSYVPSIPVSTLVGGAKVTWGWLARSICGMVGGPITALVFGAAEDTISFMVKPSGTYFPGYALTTMLGTMIYSLFLYRAKPSVVRIFLAKLCTNVLNVFLGSLWSSGQFLEKLDFTSNSDNNALPFGGCAGAHNGAYGLDRTAGRRCKTTIYLMKKTGSLSYESDPVFLFDQ